jgi:hypothetical protein
MTHLTSVRGTSHKVSDICLHIAKSLCTLLPHLSFQGLGSSAIPTIYITSILVCFPYPTSNHSYLNYLSLDCISLIVAMVPLPLLIYCSPCWGGP